MSDWMNETHDAIWVVSNRVKLRVPPGRFVGSVGRRANEGEDEEKLG